MMTSRMPDIYDAFACIGGECKCTCCMDWAVFFSEEEYEKLGQFYGDRLVREGDRYRLTFGEDGKCAFLTEEGWCSIVLKHGEEALCATGHDYPRQAICYNGIQEFHLSNGCEAVLRFFMGRREPLAFVEKEREVYYSAVRIYPAEEMMGVSDVAIALVQLRELPLWIRLCMLKRYAQEVTMTDPLLAKERYGNIDVIAEEAMNLQGIPANMTLAIEMMKTIYQVFADGAQDKNAYKLILRPLEEGIRVMQERDSADMVEAYLEFGERYREYDIFFEHVAANYLFTHCGFLLDGRRTADCASALLAEMVLIKGALFGAYLADPRNLGDENVRMVTSFFGRLIEHGMDAITGFMEANRSNAWFSEAGFALMLM